MANTINIDGHRLLWYLGLFGLLVFTLFGLHGSLQISQHLDLYYNSDIHYLYTSHAWGVAAAIVLSLAYGIFATSSKIRNSIFFLIVVTALSGYLLGGAQSHTFNGYIVGLMPVVIGISAASLAFTDKIHFTRKIINATFLVALIVVAGQLLYLYKDANFVVAIEGFYNAYKHLIFLVTFGLGLVFVLQHLSPLPAELDKTSTIITAIVAASVVVIFNIIYWVNVEGSPETLTPMWETIAACIGTIVLGTTIPLLVKMKS